MDAKDTIAHQEKISCPSISRILITYLSSSQNFDSLSTSILPPHHSFDTRINALHKIVPPYISTYTNLFPELLPLPY